MFPAKKKLFVNERISLKEKTEENTSGRSKMIPDGNTEIKQEMKISEQYKHIAKYKWIDQQLMYGGQATHGWREPWVWRRIRPWVQILAPPFVQLGTIFV